MNINTYFIDTFTSEKCRGNPTGICLTSEPVNHSVMQSIATEFDFPVSAFIQKNETQKGEYHIRFFTPTMEIPICGHAALAAARAVSERRPSNLTTFITNSGTLIKANYIGERIGVEFENKKLKPIRSNPGLLQSLKISKAKSIGICQDLEMMLIELDDPKMLRAIEPDFTAMVKADKTITEVVITSLSDDPEYDFLLRAFCPWIGIDEDPVTGSVQAVLGWYWRDRIGKSSLKSHQVSSRGGELILNVQDKTVEVQGLTKICLKSETDFSAYQNVAVEPKG